MLKYHSFINYNSRLKPGNRVMLKLDKLLLCVTIIIISN